jgi:hypothetical protein
VITPLRTTYDTFDLPVRLSSPVNQTANQPVHPFYPLRPLHGPGHLWRGPRDTSRLEQPDPRELAVLGFADLHSNLNANVLMVAGSSIPWIRRRSGQITTVHLRIATHRVPIGQNNEGEPIWSTDTYASLQPRDLDREWQGFRNEMREELERELDSPPSYSHARPRRAVARTDAFGSPIAINDDEEPGWAYPIDGSGPVRAYDAEREERLFLEDQRREERQRLDTLRSMR